MHERPYRMLHWSTGAPSTAISRVKTPYYSDCQLPQVNTRDKVEHWDVLLERLCAHWDVLLERLCAHWDVLLERLCAHWHVLLERLCAHWDVEGAHDVDEQLDVHGLQVVRRHLLALAPDRLQGPPRLEELRQARYDVAARRQGQGQGCVE